MILIAYTNILVYSIRFKSLDEGSPFKFVLFHQSALKIYAPLSFDKCFILFP